MLNLFKYKRNIYSFIKFNYSSIPYMNFDISKLEKMDMKEGIADHLQQNLINLYKEFIDALGNKDENFINNNCQKQFSKEIIENFANQRELSVNKDKKVEIELMNYEFHFKINSDRMKNRKHNVKLRKVRNLKNPLDYYENTFYFYNSDFNTKRNNILRLFTVFKTNSLIKSSNDPDNQETHYVIFDIEYSSSIALMYIINRKVDRITKFNNFLYFLIKKIQNKDYYKLQIADADNFMKGNNFI